MRQVHFLFLVQQTVEALHFHYKLCFHIKDVKKLVCFNVVMLSFKAWQFYMKASYGETHIFIYFLQPAEIFVPEAVINSDCAKLFALDILESPGRL